MYFHAILKIINFDYFRLTSQSLTYETEIPFSFCLVRDEGGGGEQREKGISVLQGTQPLHLWLRCV